MARKVRQMRGKGTHIGLVPVPSMAAPDLDTRIALIQALIPVALEKVHVELQADVKRLAGERYVREGRRLGHVRWTAQRGSIYLADQKIPLAVPRVRDRLRNQEVPLPTYERLQAPRTLRRRATAQGPRRLVHPRIRAVRGGGPGGLRLERLDGVASLQAGQCAKAAGTAGTAPRPLRRGRPAPRRQDVRGG